MPVSVSRRRRRPVSPTPESSAEYMQQQRWQGFDCGSTGPSGQATIRCNTEAITGTKPPTEDSREPAWIAKKHHQPCNSSERRYAAPSLRESAPTGRPCSHTMQTSCTNSCWRSFASRSAPALGERFLIEPLSLRPIQMESRRFFLKRIPEFCSLGFCAPRYGF